MQVLKMINRDNVSLSPKYNLGAELGAGADGQVFNILGETEKVLKLSIIYDLDYKTDIDFIFAEKRDIFSFLYEKNYANFAKIYDYGFLSSGKRKTFVGQQKYITYFYVMEKLIKLSEDEKKVFHTILSHEDLNKVKTYFIQELDRTLRDLSRGLDFSFKNIKDFYLLALTSPIKHLDIHPRNIMKNVFGEYKLIDFDRLITK